MQSRRLVGVSLVSAWVLEHVITLRWLRGGDADGSIPYWGWPLPWGRTGTTSGAWEVAPAVLALDVLVIAAVLWLVYRRWWPGRWRWVLLAGAALLALYDLLHVLELRTTWWLPLGQVTGWSVG